MGMIAFKAVQISDRERLWNIFQKYLYEMTAYYDMEMDEAGNYPYKYFDAYFGEPGRKALFIYDGETLVGFVMINAYSCLGDPIDYAIGEFTIFPRFRRRHLGLEAIERVFERYPGRWEIKYCNENKAAQRLWNRAAQGYRPILSSIMDGAESVLSFTVPKR